MPLVTSRRRNRLQLAAALGSVLLGSLGLIAGVALAFRGLEPVEWAAWVQGIGTVAAVVAAILIDQGEARRQWQQREFEFDERLRSWQWALTWAQIEMGEVLELLNPEDRAPFWIDRARTRLAGLVSSLKMYSTAEPPDPDIGRALGVALASAEYALAKVEAAKPGLGGRVAVRSCLDWARSQADEAWARYLRDRAEAGYD